MQMQGCALLILLLYNSLHATFHSLIPRTVQRHSTLAQKFPAQTMIVERPMQIPTGSTTPSDAQCSAAVTLHVVCLPPKLGALRTLL
jgi:hypothetical protein